MASRFLQDPSLKAWGGTCMPMSLAVTTMNLFLKKGAGALISVILEIIKSLKTDEVVQQPWWNSVFNGQEQLGACQLELLYFSFEGAVKSVYESPELSAAQPCYPSDEKLDTNDAHETSADHSQDLSGSMGGGVCSVGTGRIWKEYCGSMKYAALVDMDAICGLSGCDESAAGYCCSHRSLFCDVHFNSHEICAYILHDSRKDAFDDSCPDTDSWTPDVTYDIYTELWPRIKINGYELSLCDIIKSESKVITIVVFGDRLVIEAVESELAVFGAQVCNPHAFEMGLKQANLGTSVDIICDVNQNQFVLRIETPGILESMSPLLLRQFSSSKTTKDNVINLDHLLLCNLGVSPMLTLSDYLHGRQRTVGLLRTFIQTINAGMFTPMICPVPACGQVMARRFFRHIRKHGATNRSRSLCIECLLVFVPRKGVVHVCK